ncbi:MAG TPA: hypothetical protein VNH44_08275 [Micropepsaceae bacterium]|nr:hypothetical protein [Micropepsaceae bacterium]
MSQVHFEIFRQQGKSGGGWSLVEAMEDRQAALDRARTMLDEGQATAVRVVKETYQASTGDYMSLTIFEGGQTEVKKKNKKVEDIDSLSPCFKPDDLYSYHARMTMTRILGDWLGRQKLTVTELIHSASALEKFEATGTTYQHAVQKVAVAQASESESSVTQIVKQLNELCTTAIHRVYKDEKRNLFPEVQPGQFGPLATKLGLSIESRYILNGALAKYLAPARNWDAKLQRLLVLMAELPAEGPGRALLLTAIDTLVAEMLNGAAALADLLGHNPDLGHALLNLVELFLGTVVNVGEGGGRGINDLARSFAKDELPEARTAIAGRILAELKGLKRLCPSSLEEEFKMLRRLGNQLVRGQGKYLSNQDLIGAFTERSRRLVTHEPLQQFMQMCKSSDEKLERLLVVEENIVGAENKRMLSTFMMPIITSNNFEDQLSAGAPVAQRLRRVAELQERVLRSGFQDVQKNQIAVALDAVAQRIETRAKFLASIEARITNPIERAQTLLKLCAAGIFTQGDLMMKARRLLIASLAKPGFLSTYIAQLEQERRTGVDRDKVLADLATQLEGVGISPEDALRALAA